MDTSTKFFVVWNSFGWISVAVSIQNRIAPVVKYRAS